jgi:hypothetical protein
MLPYIIGASRADLAAPWHLHRWLQQVRPGITSAPHRLIDNSLAGLCLDQSLQAVCNPVWHLYIHICPLCVRASAAKIPCQACPCDALNGPAAEPGPRIQHRKRERQCKPRLLTGHLKQGPSYLAPLEAISGKFSISVLKQYQARFIAYTASLRSGRSICVKVNNRQAIPPQPGGRWRDLLGLSFLPRTLPGTLSHYPSHSPL